MSTPPLALVRVLLTRPALQARAWVAPFEEAGATVLLYPTIEVVPPPSWEPLDDAISQQRPYDWLLFTSAAAARFALGRMAERAGTSGTSASPPFPRIAAVGSETARVVREQGFSVAVVPEEQHQEGLAVALGELRPGTRVLFPQAIGGREELRNALLAKGCIVDVVPASQTIPVNALPPPPPFDVATFASPSALRAFAAGVGLDLLAGRLVAVIGPTTASAASALGLSPAVAEAPNAPALVRAIARSLPNQGAD